MVNSGRTRVNYVTQAVRHFCPKFNKNISFEMAQIEVGGFFLLFKHTHSAVIPQTKQIVFSSFFYLMLLEEIFDFAAAFGRSYRDNKKFGGKKTTE